MFQINKGDIGFKVYENQAHLFVINYFKVTFFLTFILFSWNILKVNLCIHIHRYI
jgi:hypothetical protein